MFQDLTNILQYSYSLEEILQNLFVALVCGVIISLFYRASYQGPGYLNSFLSSLVILSMITSIVIMLIGNNLARAFGLVGAMSIIRFRTAVKETHDIIFIFFSLAIGMTAGVGLYKLAFVGTITVGTISLILAKTGILAASGKEFLLQFAIDSSVLQKGEIHEDVLNKYCKSAKLINVKSANGGEISEYSYYVSFKKRTSNNLFIGELRKVEGIKQVNLFFDEEAF